MYFPTLNLPKLPLEPLALGSYIILSISVIAFAVFWIWALVHAARTPRAPWTQRLWWSLCLFINPSATIWYWCVWKRWAFWTLFTPLLGMFVALPFAVRSLMSKADATNLTNGLYALGSNGLVVFFAILLIYPVVLKLAVTLDATSNGQLSALDRNDWVLCLSFPMIGFGASLVYAVKHLRPWAFGSLAWLLTFSFVSKAMIWNVAPLLVPAGEERREIYKELHP